MRRANRIHTVVQVTYELGGDALRRECAALEVTVRRLSPARALLVVGRGPLPPRKSLPAKVEAMALWRFKDRAHPRRGGHTRLTAYLLLDDLHGAAEPFSARCGLQNVKAASPTVIPEAPTMTRTRSPRSSLSSRSAVLMPRGTEAETVFP